MPFVDDQELDDAPLPNIGTDLFENLSNSDEEPLGAGPAIPEILQVEEVETVVRIEDAPLNQTLLEGNGVDQDQEQESDKDEDEDEDEDIPAATMSDEAPAEAAPKKRGRAPLATSRPATPKSAKGNGPLKGRKRKAEVSADEPAVKRSGRGRATAAAASEAIKKTSAKRPRAAPSTAKAAPKTKTTGAKRGPKPGAKARKQAIADGEEEEEVEYEVEEIVDNKARGRSTVYLVKWKGYGESENTWEPKANLEHAADLLEEYETSQKEDKKEKKKPGPKKGAAPASKATASAKKAATPKKATPAKKPAGRPSRTRRH